MFNSAGYLAKLKLFSVKKLAAKRREKLGDAQTLHQFLRDIDDEEAWIK